MLLKVMANAETKASRTFCIYNTDWHNNEVGYSILSDIYNKLMNLRGKYIYLSEAL